MVGFVGVGVSGEVVAVLVGVGGEVVLIGSKGEGEVEGEEEGEGEGVGEGCVELHLSIFSAAIPR